MQLAVLSLLAFVVAAGALFSMHLEQPSQRAGAPRRRRGPVRAERSLPKAASEQQRGTDAA